jgi:hypothetical protein
MRLTWAVLLLVPLVAGCSGGDRGPSDEVEPEDCDLEPALCDPTNYLANHPCYVNEVRPRVFAPDTPGPDTEANPWQQGDYWRYRLTVDGDSHETELVYYDDADFSGGQAQHYLVGVQDREEALDHALFSVNPMLGRIHRTLYSPHEGGVHADMFYFPLCEGSTWSTSFYDTAFTLEASRQALDLPGSGSDPLGFSIDGTASDGSTLHHTYSPQVKWFTELELRRADGLAVDLQLLEWGSGRTGRMEFLRAQKDEVVDLAAAQFDNAGRASFDMAREEGGEGPYDQVGLWLDAQRSGSGKVEVHLRDPAGTSRACVGFAGSGLAGATPCPQGPLKVEIPWQEGAWTVTVERGLLDPATVSGEARVVSIYERGGTV